MRTTQLLSRVAIGGLLSMAVVTGASAQSSSEAELPDPAEIDVGEEERSSTDGAGVDETSSEASDDRLPDPAAAAPDAESSAFDLQERGAGETEEDEPPIQVRRAVRKIRTQARSVAGSVADEQEADGGEPAEPQIRRLTRETSGKSEGKSGEEAADAFFHSMQVLLEDSPKETLSLEPYVDDDRWNRAMRLLVDDKCRRALETAETVLEESERELESVPAVEYAMARIKMCAGRAGEGRRTLEKLAKGDGAVARVASRRLGRKPEAIEAEGEQKGWLDRVEAARERAGEGTLDEALTMLDALEEEVEPGWPFYKVEMTEINLLLRHGREASAGRELFGLYRVARDWQLADDLVSRIETVERRHDLEILTLGARVDRMRELIHQGDYEIAEDVSVRNAKLAGVGGSEIKGWGAYRRALQAEDERNRERAAELFAKAERLVESPVIRPRLYFGWARAERRLDDNARAIELYRRLCREYPQNHLCDDARFEIGRLSQYSNEHRQARKAFVNLLATYPNSEHVPEALWRGAFSTYLLGEYEAVDRPLQTLIQRFPEKTDASGLRLALKAKYWLGVAAAERGDDVLAKRRFQRTIDSGSLTWYGRLAARRMREIGGEPTIPRPPGQIAPTAVHDPASLDLPKHSRYRVAGVYTRLGLYRDALEEMERQLEVEPLPEKARRFHASLELANGNRAAAHWLMQEEIESSAPTRDTVLKWGIAYPMEFREPVRKYGTKYDVSPHLVQAVMREESGFRPEVSSGVGAVGLMQLMPGSANVLQDDYFGGSRLSRSDLQKPKTNVRLGTAYLRVLLSWAKSRLPVVLAGYNAGPAPVKDWYQRFGDRSIDAWVESITYQQARAYVRKVYTSYTRYQAIYGGTLPSPQLTLPNGFNRWGEAPQLRQESKPEAVSMSASD